MGFYYWCEEQTLFRHSVQGCSAQWGLEEGGCEKRPLAGQSCFSWVWPQEIPKHNPSPGTWRSGSQGWVAFCSSMKCNIHYEEKLLVTANRDEVCFLEVMCSGLQFLFIFVTEKTAKRVQVKHVDLGSLQENSPCIRGTRCCPKISCLLCQLHHCRLSACCNTQTQLCGFRGW